MWWGFDNTSLVCWLVCPYIYIRIYIYILDTQDLLSPSVNKWACSRNMSSTCLQHMLYSPIALLCVYQIMCIVSLSQWLNFKLSGITCLVGKISRLNNGFISGSRRDGWVSYLEVFPTTGKSWIPSRVPPRWFWKGWFFFMLRNEKTVDWLGYIEIIRPSYVI